MTDSLQARRSTSTAASIAPEADKENDMLKSKLLHPEILRVLGSSGHFSQVLIADGNYPFASRSGPNATTVYLNLMPGIPKVTDVLEALLAMIPVQEAAVMQTPNGETPPIHEEFVRMLPRELEIKRLERYAFYDAACSPLTSLVIATAETRRFANLLLTIGVVKLETNEGF
jgi:L-fucose mutarotase